MPTLRTAQGSPHARLMSIAGYRGSRVVDNAEMCTIIESSDEWIQQRTGIIERRWATPEETVGFMAVQAGRKAIERAGLQPSDIDALYISTVSHYMQSPSLAVAVAQELGCPEAAALDISAGCAGFCYLIGLADSVVRAGTARHVLVIGAERLTDMTNLADRSTAFLFADGAGAAVVGPSQTPGISPTVWGSEADKHDVIVIDDWREVLAGDQQMPVIRMAGSQVFRWATTAIAEKARQIIAESGITADELDAFIPHQANNRITDSMLRHLKLPESVVVSRDIKHMGNSSSASIPIAMDALLESGEAQPGQTALLIGFGSGLAYAGQIVVLP